MRPSLPRQPGLPTRLQIVIDLAGGFDRAATRSGIARRTLGDWVRKKNHVVPVAQLARFAEGCGVDLHWLRTGEGDPPRRLTEAVLLPMPTEPIAAELTPPVDLENVQVQPGGQVGVASIGPSTVLSLAPDWAASLGLGGGAISTVSADETAEPRIPLGEPVLAARVADARNALALHPDSVWLVDVESRIVLRTILVSDEVAHLTTVGAKKTTTKIPLQNLVIRGRAVWVGVRL